MRMQCHYSHTYINHSGKLSVIFFKLSQSFAAFHEAKRFEYLKQPKSNIKRKGTLAQDMQSVEML